MNTQKYVSALDRWQQNHRVSSIIFAVFKKYGEDKGGYMAALLTYYGFLSLFPLLLVFVTLLQLWFHNDHIVQQQVSTSVGHFFPLLGTQLQENIHGVRGTGFGLIVGLLIAIYGTRGAADAFRHALDDMWQIPRNRRAGFPKNILHSLAIIAAAGAGFAATIIVSAFTANIGPSQWSKILANLLGFVILASVLGYAYRIATAGRLRLRYMLLGAALAAAAIQLLLSFGGIILAHELKNMGSLYGTFAVVLGTIFWIYLISQIVLIAAEIDTVRHFHLWPRSITTELQSDADRKAYRLYAQADKYAPNETIKTFFGR